MACIFRRGKTWSYSVDIGKSIDGTRRKKMKGGFRTQAEAKKAAIIVEAEVAQQIFVDEKKITFAAYAERWLELYRPTVKISTTDLRKNHCTVLKRLLGNKLLTEIHAGVYQQMLLCLQKEGYAPKTISDIHHTASLIFKSACQRKILKENPAAGAVMPRRDNGLYTPEAEDELPKYMEKQELLLFLDAAKAEGTFATYVLFMLLAYTGMRIGELMGLQWQDIDFVQQEISINRTVYIKERVAEYLLLTPKTRNSKRRISITDDIVALLKKHRTKQLKERMAASGRWHDGGFVFTSLTFPGYPLPKQTIQYRMKKILQRAHLNPSITPHSLRHTHASLLAEAGVTLEAIMERLGHANDDVTRRIYLHITKHSKRDAAQKFCSLMGNLSG